METKTLIEVQQRWFLNINEILKVSRTWTNPKPLSFSNRTLNNSCEVKPRLRRQSHECWTSCDKDEMKPTTS